MNYAKDINVRCLLITGDAVGGIRLHVHSIIEELLHRGLNVAYACSLHADVRGDKEIEAFDNMGVPILRRGIFKGPAFSDFVNIIIFARFAKRHKINLIHGHGAKGGLYSRVIGFLIGAKVIYTPHGGVVHAMFSPINTVVYSLLERFLYYLTDYFLFESNYTRNEFFRLVGRSSIIKSMVNYNGIHNKFLFTSKSINPSGNNAANILVVGMLRREKGQEVMLCAARILKNRGMIFSLNFCGNGPSLSKLKMLTNQLGLDEFVNFHGDVSNPQLLFEKSTLVVIPSLFESFGYVAIEAANNHRVIVASRVGGLCEIIIDEVSGLLVEPGNATDLADKIQYLIQNPKKALLLSEAAFSRCSNLFSIEKMMSNLVACYAGLIQRC